MSLVKRHKLTPRKLAANRTSGRLSRGPATPEGRERIRAANTRHGFYAQGNGEALRALGEDPADFERLVESLIESWQPVDGFEERLVMRLARALWRMERSDRVQESIAVRQLERQAERRDFREAYVRQHTETVIERMKALAAAAAKADYCADPSEIELFQSLYGPEPDRWAKRILALLRDLLKPAPAGAEAAERKARDEARKELQRLLWEVIRASENEAEQESDLSTDTTSRFERDEMLAPVHTQAALMMRMEDSSFLQVWRLTDMLMRLKRRPLHVPPPLDEGISDDVDENKGK